MKKFAIIHGEITNGLQKRALEELTKILLEYTLEYPICLNVKSASDLSNLKPIYIGTRATNSYISSHSDNSLSSLESYRISVKDSVTVIEGYDDAGVLYGVLDFYNQYVVKHEYPDFDPEERHQVWRELLGLYMPWVKPGEVPFYGEGKGWQRQQHIYTSPFYYIDYCLAQTVSLEFWRLIRQDPKEAFQTYLRYTEQGGSKVFTELLSNAGLSSPFEENTIKRICEEAMAFIESYDLTGIE